MAARFLESGFLEVSTVTAGLCLDGLVAPWLLDGPMDGEAFLVYVRRVLVPILTRDDIVIIDNLPAHKVGGVREAIEAKEAQLLYLPPYSPDFNPIDTFTPTECQNYFAASGYYLD